jgi:hypothetical protein
MTDFMYAPFLQRMVLAEKFLNFDWTTKKQWERVKGWRDHLRQNEAFQRVVPSEEQVCSIYSPYIEGKLKLKLNWGPL